MSLRSLTIAAALCFALCLPARAHMAGETSSLGFPPTDYFEDHADEDFVPASLTPAQGQRLRGVVSRLQVWEAGKTLSVCFLSGTKKARNRVMETAREWTKWARIAFDAGDAGNPRSCETAKGKEAADIKIGFVAGDGYWSYLGKQSLDYSQSMNFDGFGKDDLPVTISQESFTGTVLHEFGHALGLEHEHQSPKANCENEFDWPAIYAWGRSNGWSKAMVDFNMRRLLNTKGGRRFSKYDPKSIMHYSLPVVFFKKGRASACHVEENVTLSKGDKAFIALIYPGRVEKRKPYTDFLLSEFEGILKEAGLPEEEIAERIKALPTQFNISTITAGGDVIQDGGVKIEGDATADDGSVQIIGGSGNPSVSVTNERGDDDDDEDDEDENNKPEDGGLPER